MLLDAMINEQPTPRNRPITDVSIDKWRNTRAIMREREIERDAQLSESLI